MSSVVAAISSYLYIFRGVERIVSVSHAYSVSANKLKLSKIMAGATLKESTNTVSFSTPKQSRRKGRSKRKSGIGSGSVETPQTPGNANDEDGCGLRGILSPNCDDKERADSRQKRRESIERRIALLTPHRKNKTGPGRNEGENGSDSHSIREERMKVPVNMLKNEQILDLYKSCIKLASENKINAKNTWSLQLIDHLSDIVHDEKEGPNFQKASCTLDAGVKIYSSRVDSTHTETFKVLGGLSKSKSDFQDDSENIIDDNDAGVNDINTVEKKVRRGKRSGEVDKEGQTVECFTANLEPEDSLQAKELATAYNTDPLFAKMSAAFDEGGGTGMLLYNLPCLRGCELAFDANEKPLDKLQTSTNDEAMDDAYSRTIKSEVTIDLSWMEKIVETSKRILNDNVVRITPSFGALLSVGNNDENFNDTGVSNDSQFSGHVVSHALDNDENDLEADSFQDDSMMDSWADDDDEEGEDNEGSEERSGPSAAMFAFASMSITEGKEGVNAADWLESLSGVGSGMSGKSWAGVSHWRYRAPAADAQSNGDSQASSSEASKKKAKTKSTTHEIINFRSPEVVPDSAFQVASDCSKICVSEKTLNCFADTMLPEDFQYEAKSLGRLFLKPCVPLKKLLRRIKPSDSLKTDSKRQDQCQTTLPIGEISGLNDDDDDDVNDIWADGIDDEGVDGNVSSEEDDSWFEGKGESEGLLKASHRVEKIDIAFDKRPKQVDVRALKTTIWENVLTRSDNKESEFVDSFSEIIATIPKDNPAGHPNDISVHLCFICMLHLANENNLTINDDPSMTELKISGM